MASGLSADPSCPARLPPEAAHELTLRALDWARSGFSASLPVAADPPALAAAAFGVSNFPNPVGLAAGYDKDAGFPTMPCSSDFGFVEVGTVTPRPQGRASQTASVSPRREDPERSSSDGLQTNKVGSTPCRTPVDVGR